MGLAAVVLAQALVSLAPTLDNVRLLSPERTEYQAPAPPALAADPGGGGLLALPDTVRRRRAISLSYGYYRRLEVHRVVGYGVPPLFVLEYLAGQKLLEQGSAAPLWAEKVHKPAAYVLAGLFTVNTVTGLINMAEARKVESGKTRRWVHTLMMLAADAGFIYGASVAPSTAKIDDRIAGGQRGGWTPHKITTVASMSVATAAHVMMYLWKD
ncbi:MAG: hypothetical protein KA180_07960 [Gemmatimonadales bacterium]|jgi:hypothetical protein|nr:hypothetical protein [Gemmatimonadota bacterium]MBP6669368.1 hypothetical protein [Gemmatimonadales bacterium]MBK6780665.1 hypothetical protein [Gemmatimonadota bacterium]MBK7351517.1 hypothetical protein [Gemmatimonadota bacterium]MBK7786680.1 hypothetical protein [Gemmatimonadota bacterium]